MSAEPMSDLQSLLEEIVAATVDAVEPDRIILFGSRARGESHSDSDLDLLVVEHEPFKEGRSRSGELRRIRRALWRFPLPIDVLVYSAAEVEDWRDSPNHIISRCLREGVTLYERQ